MPVTLRTHQDIAGALRTLGLTLETAKKADPAKTGDPELARAVLHELRDMSGKELKRLQAAIGGGGAPSSVEPRQHTGASLLSVRLPAKKNGKEPRLDANLPQVAVLLQSYGVDGKAPRPLERVLVHAAKIHGIVTSERDSKVLLDKVMAGDLRRFVFLLEGMGKLYGKRYGEAEEVYVSAKRLEDSLGAVSATRTNLAYARQVKAPADVLTQLETQERAAVDALQRLLEKEWMPDAKGRVPALKDLMKGWGEAEWDDYVDDKKVVRQELIRRLEKLADTSYDMNDLQGGLHELRRQLRWFPIYAEGVNGLVQLDTGRNPVAAYAPMLSTELASSKYVQLPDDSREVGALQISKSLYTALMQLTLDLGALKDTGEPLEALWHAYMATGRAGTLDEARAQVATHLGLTSSGTSKADQLVHDVHTEAHRLYAAMKDNRLVESLADELRRT